MNPLEEALYARVALEIANKNLVPGIMAKALVDADGDQKKAVARYIRYRVDQFLQEIKAEAEKERQTKVEPERGEGDRVNDEARRYTKCPKCGWVGEMAPAFSFLSRLLFITFCKCPQCKLLFDWYYARDKSESGK